MQRVVVSAPAKVNVYLGVSGARDERGYHQLDTVMMTVGLADLVEVAPADRLCVEMPGAACAETDNTCYKMARAAGEAFGFEPAVRVRLEKSIPAEAGLGGGSADAAATLVALNELYGLGASPEDLRCVAARVGADVPFFLDGAPAWYVGAGDVLRQTFGPVEGAVVLVRPAGHGVSTPAAYAAFDARPVAAGPIEPVLDAARAGDCTSMAKGMSNNLDPVARRLLPACAEAAAWLEGQAGVVGSQVTGSGSCVFGVCEDDAAARRIAEAARGQGWWSAATRFQGAGARLLG